MAKLSAVKVFSVLVASGHGDRCNTLRAGMRDALLRRDRAGAIDAVTWKNRGEAGIDVYRRLGRRVLRIVEPLLDDVPEHVLGPDGRGWDLERVN